MVSITDNLKEGLKYPLYEPKKVGILGALYFIITFIVLGAGHIFFSSIKYCPYYNIRKCYCSFR
ncbi:MAG: hypothetical protein MJ203_02275 [archaeon]|nr:hypothetical protein [archaeon]